MFVKNCSGTICVQIEPCNFEIVAFNNSDVEIKPSEQNELSELEEDLAMLLLL